eukprot:TRINITY_DN14590_c0_g1_i1.p1 TRINITY_DN14590_c0_g1~~TRINITY_DN14590_c0_g1_i1.p1  ORF type:complete len:1627 (+),score=232.73 TRINITY_DN14590_c0_g1_i1:22-4881(+)
MGKHHELFVTVKEARGLPPLLDAPLAPYAVLTWDASEWRTSALCDTTAPRWNERVQLTYEGDELVLHVAVFDATNDSHIGSAEVDIGALDVGRDPVDIWFSLRNNGVESGDVRLVLHTGSSEPREEEETILSGNSLPTHITVTVREAAGLPNEGSAHVVLVLGDQEGKTDNTDCPNPRWNESFTFEAEDEIVKIELWHSDGNDFELWGDGEISLREIIRFGETTAEHWFSLHNETAETAVEVLLAFEQERTAEQESHLSDTVSANLSPVVVDTEKNHLSLIVKEAKGLSHRQQGRSYVSLRMGEIELRSRAAEGDAPCWEEEFLLPDPDTTDDVLSIKVYEVAEEPRFLGTTNVDLGDLFLQYGSVEKWFPLDVAHRPAGAILLRLQQRGPPKISKQTQPAPEPSPAPVPIPSPAVAESVINTVPVAPPSTSNQLPATELEIRATDPRGVSIDGKYLRILTIAVKKARGVPTVGGSISVSLRLGPTEHSTATTQNLSWDERFHCGISNQDEDLYVVLWEHTSGKKEQLGSSTVRVRELALARGPVERWVSVFSESAFRNGEVLLGFEGHFAENERKLTRRVTVKEATVTDLPPSSEVYVVVRIGSLQRNTSSAAASNLRWNEDFNFGADCGTTLEVEILERTTRRVIAEGSLDVTIIGVGAALERWVTLGQNGSDRAEILIGLAGTFGEHNFSSVTTSEPTVTVVTPLAPSAPIPLPAHSRVASLLSNRASVSTVETTVPPLETKVSQALAPQLIEFSKWVRVHVKSAKLNRKAAREGLAISAQIQLGETVDETPQHLPDPSGTVTWNSSFHIFARLPELSVSLFADSLVGSGEIEFGEMAVRHAKIFESWVPLTLENRHVGQVLISIEDEEKTADDHMTTQRSDVVEAAVSVVSDLADACSVFSVDDSRRGGKGNGEEIRVTVHEGHGIRSPRQLSHFFFVELQLGNTCYETKDLTPDAVNALEWNEAFSFRGDSDETLKVSVLDSAGIVGITYLELSNVEAGVERILTLCTHDGAKNGTLRMSITFPNRKVPSPCANVSLTGTLVVEIEAAVGLSCSDSAKPQCIVRAGNVERGTGPPRKGSGRDPIWTDTLELPAPETGLLQFIVRDTVLGTELGSGEVNAQAVDSGPIERWVPLSAGSKIKPAGQLRVTIARPKQSDTSQPATREQPLGAEAYLLIEVKQSIELPATPNGTRLRITLGQLCAETETQRSTRPSWDEIFKFSDLSSTRLRIEVLDGSSDRVLGSGALELDSLPITSGTVDQWVPLRDGSSRAGRVLLVLEKRTRPIADLVTIVSPVAPAPLNPTPVSPHRPDAILTTTLDPALPLAFPKELYVTLQEFRPSVAFTHGKASARIANGSFSQLTPSTPAAASVMWRYTTKIPVESARLTIEIFHDGGAGSKPVGQSAVHLPSLDFERHSSIDQYSSVYSDQQMVCQVGVVRLAFSTSEPAREIETTLRLQSNTVPQNGRIVQGNASPSEAVRRSLQPQLVQAQTRTINLRYDRDTASRLTHDDSGSAFVFDGPVSALGTPLRRVVPPRSSGQLPQQLVYTPQSPLFYAAPNRPAMDRVILGGAVVHSPGTRTALGARLSEFPVIGDIALPRTARVEPPALSVRRVGLR